EVVLEDVAEAAHARLAGQVEDAVVAGEVELIPGEVEPEDVEPARVLLLQSRVVVVGEAVDPDDAVAVLGQRRREVRADEARRACDRVPHRASLLPRRAGGPETVEEPAGGRGLALDGDDDVAGAEPPSGRGRRHRNAAQ